MSHQLPIRNLDADWPTTQNNSSSTYTFIFIYSVYFFLLCLISACAEKNTAKNFGAINSLPSKDSQYSMRCTCMHGGDERKKAAPIVFFPSAVVASVRPSPRRRRKTLEPDRSFPAPLLNFSARPQRSHATDSLHRLYSEQKQSRSANRQQQQQQQHRQQRASEPKQPEQPEQRRIAVVAPYKGAGCNGGGGGGSAAAVKGSVYTLVVKQSKALAEGRRFELRCGDNLVIGRSQSLAGIVVKDEMVSLRLGLRGWRERACHILESEEGGQGGGTGGGGMAGDHC